MGAAITPDAMPLPARVHGIKHWLEWTIDLRPSQYHVVMRYQDSEGDPIGLARAAWGPGNLAKYCEDGEALFADVVKWYEDDEDSADEIIQHLDQAGVSQLFADAWPSHIPMPEEP